MGWNEHSDPDTRTANFKFSCDVYREGVYRRYSKFAVRMSGSESSFHPIELCVNQRISRQDKMPTCCVVDCENRISSGVKFFRIPAGSHPFKKK